MVPPLVGFCFALINVAQHPFFLVPLRGCLWPLELLHVKDKSWRDCSWVGKNAAQFCSYEGEDGTLALAGGRPTLK